MKFSELLTEGEKLPSLIPFSRSFWGIKWRRGKLKEIEYYLGGELGAETLAEEDGVGVHEMPKTLLHTIHEYRFHGCYFRIRFQKRRRRKLRGKLKKRGFWFRFRFRFKNQIKSNENTTWVWWHVPCLRFQNRSRDVVGHVMRCISILKCSVAISIYIN